jgi:hypothetical protein
MQAQSAGRLDRVGQVLSAVCVVHCLLMPWLLGLLPIIADAEGAEQTSHAAIAAACLLIGVATFAPSYRLHRRVRSGLAAVVAYALMGLAIAADGRPWANLESALSIARSLLRNSAKHLKSLESGKMQFANDFKDFHVLRGHSATRS